MELSDEVSSRASTIPSASTPSRAFAGGSTLHLAVGLEAPLRSWVFSKTISSLDRASIVLASNHQTDDKVVR